MHLDLIFLTSSFIDAAIFFLPKFLKSNQGNQDSSGNPNNVIQGQRPDMENKHNKEH